MPAAMSKKSLDEYTEVMRERYGRMSAKRMVGMLPLCPGLPHPRLLTHTSTAAADQPSRQSGCPTRPGRARRIARTTRGIHRTPCSGFPCQKQVSGNNSYNQAVLSTRPRPSEAYDFATSLPNLLVFEEDLQARRDGEHHLLIALAHHGLGDPAKVQEHLNLAPAFTHTDQRAAHLAHSLQGPRTGAAGWDRRRKRR